MCVCVCVAEHTFLISHIGQFLVFPILSIYVTFSIDTVCRLLEDTSCLLVLLITSILLHAKIRLKQDTISTK